MGVVCLLAQCFLRSCYCISPAIHTLGQTSPGSWLAECKETEDSMGREWVLPHSSGTEPQHKLSDVPDRRQESSLSLTLSQALGTWLLAAWKPWVSLPPPSSAGSNINIPRSHPHEIKAPRSIAGTLCSQRALFGLHNCCHSPLYPATSGSTGIFLYPLLERTLLVSWNYGRILYNYVYFKGTCLSR